MAQVDSMDISLPPDSLPVTYLIAGLGNPGREYRDTRHNVGFMLVDRLSERLKVSFTRMESKALVTKTEYEGRRLVIVKPQMYMNLSGQPIASLKRYYKITESNLLVVYDDVDLPLGSLRLRPAGGSAGQKGMMSIIDKLGSDAFPRLRIGIDRPPGRMDAADYVLQTFPKNDRDLLLATLDRAVEAVFCFVTQGLEMAMNKFN